MSGAESFVRIAGVDEAGRGPLVPEILNRDATPQSPGAAQHGALQAPPEQREAPLRQPAQHKVLQRQPAQHKVLQRQLTQHGVLSRRFAEIRENLRHDAAPQNLGAAQALAPFFQPAAAETK